MNTIKRLVNPSKILPISLALLLFWFIVAFLLYPNLNLIFKTFFHDGSFTLEPFQQLLSSSRAMKSLLNTFILAFSMVITVNIVGVFLVLVTEYFEIKGMKIVKLGYLTTLILHGIILVSGYQFVYGPNGVVTNFLLGIFPNMDPNWFTGFGAVLFVMTFAMTSYHFVFLTTAIRKVDYSTIEVARSMGTSEFKIITQIVLPVLKPTLFAVTVLVFYQALNALSAPLVVGGESFQTINSMILNLVNSVYSRGVASILAIILGLATFIVLFFLMKSEAKGNYIAVSKVSTKIEKKKIAHKPTNILVHFIAYLLFVIYMLPVVFICIFSFTDSYSITTGTLSLDRFTLVNYIDLFTKISAYKPYLVSTVYSLVAGAVVAVLCLFVSRILHKSKNKLVTNVLEYSMLIPWFLPASMLALGLILAYDTSKWFMGNYILVGSVWIMLIAYIIIRIPFTLRLLKATFFSIDSSLEEVAKSMGAKPFYTFRRVILPIILPATLAVIALNFQELLVNYDLSVFLYHPLYQPLTIVVQTSTQPDAPGDTRAIALIYSVVVMIISALALYFIYGKNSKN